MNFDEPVDRNLFPTMKWSKQYLHEHFGNEEVIPMSVADMDLKAPPAVIDRLQERAAHGIYGYEYRPESYFASLSSWYQDRYGWKIDQTHIEPCPSIMNAIAILIHQHSKEGEGIILQPPVFFEFRMAIKSNDRTVVKNPLILKEGKYQIDFEDLERKASDPHNKVLILCSPHNPVGRVWTRAELAHIAEICARHEVFVIADEVHGDIALPPNQYTPFLKVSEKAAQNGAACLSPGKTFNIAGMVDAIAVIPNESRRQQFHDFAHRFQMNKVNLFATAAAEAAYQHGAAWLDDLLLYLQGNVNFVREYLQEHVHGVSLIEPEGTFLAWLDFRELCLDAKELERFLADEAGIALSQGYWFGREGAGFARMTIGCPRETIRRALDQLAAAVRKLPLIK